MHSVTESATVRSDRRSPLSLRITTSARRLSDERGVEGFTMEELAAEADVSRRTLFNHCAGKVDAILGPAPTFPDGPLAVFRAGGPHGDLLHDLRALAHAILDAEEVDRDELARIRRILLANPKLLIVTHERFAALSEQLVREIELREGPDFGRQRAKVAIAVLCSLFDAALTALLHDEDGRLLPDHFDEALRFAGELFAHPARRSQPA
jgi:AcrR family transcriptional regulator